MNTPKHFGVMTEAERVAWGAGELSERLREIEKVKAGQMQLADAQWNAKRRRELVGATDGDAFRYIRSSRS